MPTLEREKVVSRAMLVLLLLGGFAIASWWRIGAPWEGGAPALHSGYYTSALQRTGASTDRLIENLQARLRQAPGDWASYSQLGLAYLQKARETGDPTYYQKAEGVLQRALALEPEDYTAVSAMGTLALARHQFLSALEWGEHALRINPDRAYAYGVVADAQIELGRYAEAIATLQQMVDLRPDSNSYSRISYARELHGDVEGAIEMMQQAVEAGGAAESGAWHQTQLASLYLNRGDLEQAESAYQRALDRFPGYAYALAGLGRVRAAQGRTPEAIALLRQASERTPLPEFAITLGDLYLVTGKPDAAQQQYALVRAMQQLYEANGVDLDMEVALFDADHGSNPRQVVERARAAYGRRPSIYAADVLAWALYQDGDYSGAQRYSREALRLGTRDAMLHYHAGMIAYALGDRPAAGDHLRAALGINPYFSLRYGPEARDLLERLQESK